MFHRALITTAQTGTEL